MVNFRQVIRPGQSGSDVRAVKDAMRRMHVVGSGALGDTKFAGAQFVKLIKHVQRHHALKVDGIYGRSTHKVIAPHFTARDVFWYKTARFRKPVEPPVTKLSAQEAARKLEQFHTQGKYRADNPPDLTDIQRTARGEAVWSQAGRWVHIDKRVLEALVFLIEQGYKIGTFAICSDHHYDGPHGHSGGHAVDISSINGVSVVAGNETARRLTQEVAELLHSHMPVTLEPWQQICDGYGGMHYGPISELTIPSPAYYGYTTMSEHRNHIHLGYFGN